MYLRQYLTSGQKIQDILYMSRKATWVKKQNIILKNKRFVLLILEVGD